MKKQNSIKVTVLIHGSFCVAIFERNDEHGYTVARHIFGNEPTDTELYQFIMEHYHKLKFTEPQKDIKLIIKRKNHKRMSREVRREMQRMSMATPMTRAQEVLKLELEKNKKIRKKSSKEQIEAKKEKRFQLKQQKKKKKQRGH